MRGSSLSRSASPRRLMPSSVSAMQRPGKRPSQTACSMNGRPAASMLPQVGAGGGTPRPRKRQRAFRQDRPAEHRGRQHGDRCQAVGQDVAQHGVDFAIAHDTRGFDEFAFAQRQDGAAHHTRHRRRVGDAKREDDAVLVSPEDREQPERQQDARKGEQRVVDGHDDAIDPAAGIAADEADQRAADDREGDRQACRSRRWRGRRSSSG